MQSRKDLLTKDSRSLKTLLGAQQLASRKGGDSCQAELPILFSLNAQGQHGGGGLHNMFAGPADPFLAVNLIGRLTGGIAMPFSLCLSSTASVTMVPRPGAPAANAVQGLLLKEVM